jgi:signal transduction histidine kinase
VPDTIQRKHEMPQLRSQLDRPPCPIYGTGEMAERIRAFDWSTTPVGPVHQWPELLLSTVNTLLGSRQPMFLWWGEELIQFYNDAYRPSIGADKHPSALGQRGEECWPEIWPVISPLIDDVMKRGQACWSEDQLIPIYRDGQLVDVYWTFSYSPVWDAKGNICGTLVVCSETTGRILAERAVLTERARLFDVLQQAPAFFALLHGPDHVITMVNPLYLRLVNHREVLGKPVGVALPDAAEQGYVEILDRVYREGEPYAGVDVRFDVFAGEGLQPDERYVDFTYQPLHESDGTISGIIVLGVDVTLRKKAHDALIKAEKLAVVGRLASSIAHEINNPLESVTNLIYLVRNMNQSPAIHQHLVTAERELLRVSAITSQTLRFHKQSTRPIEATGKELIDSVLSLYQGRIVNSRIQIEQRHRQNAAVRCFEGEIRQVLSNLIGNALDAMQHSGGRLILRSRSGTDQRTGRSGIIITVADTGPGMPRAVLNQIFEPFFTTKGSLGTGLGLWISREIIDRHAGRLTLRTSNRKHRAGTAVMLFLPFDAVHR